MKKWKQAWKGWLARALTAAACSATTLHAQELNLTALAPLAAPPPGSIAPEDLEETEARYAAVEEAIPRRAINEPFAETQKSPETAGSGVVHAIGKAKDKQGGIRQASCSTCSKGLIGGL